MIPAVDETHDPSLRSWVESANRTQSDFPIQNLPFGVFTRRGANEPPRIGVAIGEHVLDMESAAEARLLATLPVEIREALAQPELNTLMALGHDAMRTLRRFLVQFLRADNRDANARLLAPLDTVTLHLPATIGDYTDFYASVHHATRVGRLFRPDNPLLPNYKYVPIAYHGRASSIVPSGTPIQRPSGQTKSVEDAHPVFRASRSLDYELEAGMFIGTGNGLGHPIDVEHAEDHIFGLCLLNDWSARDVQAWEYQPLGPFLAKNFATTVSPWIVTMEALAPFRSASAPRPAGDPEPLPYLARRDTKTAGIDVRVEACLSSAQMRQRGLPSTQLGHASLSDLYWDLAQMVAHHTSNGCNLRPGDLLGTGTISGPEDDARGCLLEITSNGRQPIELPSGESRTFLADADMITLLGHCERDGFVRIGFGECSGTVLPPR